MVALKDLVHLCGAPFDLASQKIAPKNSKLGPLSVVDERGGRFFVIVKCLHHKYVVAQKVYQQPVLYPALYSKKLIDDQRDT